jgi:hypothetical protein
VLCCVCVHADQAKTLPVYVEKTLSDSPSKQLEGMQGIRKLLSAGA